MKKISSGTIAVFLAFALSTHAQTLEFNAGVYVVNEDAGTATLTVTKSGSASQPVTVHYTTADNPADPVSANAPDDYATTSGDLTFAPNETSKQITVPIVDDAVYEGNETFYVVLSNPSGGAALRDPWSAQVNIREDDPPPTVQFSSANYSANEGAGTATLTLTKTGPTDVPVTVYYKTRDGTAHAPSDYTFTGDDLSASVVFAPAETSMEIQIPIANDNFLEPSETFEVFIVVSFDGTRGTPETATVTIIDNDPGSPQPPAQVLNISTRSKVDSGDRVMIGGFIITGNDSKPVVLRGMGPSLGGAGLPPNQVLLDPVIRLHGPNGSLMTENDNWKDNPAQRAQIEGTIFEPTDDREAVIVAFLQPGTYTAVLTGKGQTGIGLVEAYDNNRNTDSRLANISTRGYVGMENDVMIGGFTVGGDPANVNIAVRGLGPSLASSGLSNVLPDPILELHNANGTVMISNDNWQSDPVSAAQLTANGLGLPDAKESGIFISLPPGQFTAILTGKNGLGIGLIEIYNVK